MRGDHRPEVNGFFDYALASELIDQLAEYSVSGQTIRHGSRTGTTTITEPALGASISDAQIQQTLQQLTQAGTTPPPTANTLYFLYLPPNISVTQGGSRSCQGFCGYHNATSADLYYAVMPYLRDRGGQLYAALGICLGQLSPGVRTLAHAPLQTLGFRQVPTFIAASQPATASFMLPWKTFSVW